ncbi:hypothetical protein DFH07DRAFT_863293 [Mycena maculata]|uniref:Uncharacterized protein n=1 Tax=Mycena maculata TaxID=230809 RepID=A0AAD7MF48_9AGAR|nr:hypothetical protein DFH07DRAFT_863293 [Mycena maculata]
MAHVLASADAPNPPPALMIIQTEIARNKRCLLAYHNHRISFLCPLYWSLGASLRASRSRQRICMCWSTPFATAASSRQSREVSTFAWAGGLWSVGREHLIVGIWRCSSFVRRDSFVV